MIFFVRCKHHRYGLSVKPMTRWLAAHLGNDNYFAVNGDNVGTFQTGLFCRGSQFIDYE